MESTVSKGHPALTDAQTGLPNALHWDTVFGVIFAAGDRGIPLTLILLEIENFSAWAGDRDSVEVDRILASLGSSLENTTRSSDLAARVGDARFAFLLMDCNMAGGRLVADRLDALLDPHREAGGLSFSMGVAAYNREMLRSEQLVADAESALRAAQAGGENQIEFA
jgi:two-component system cell cycle response regulator